MDGAAFINELSRQEISNPGNNVFQTIWAEYERVVLNSLITSFGLDFLVRDQHGGDVDTIHNVREIGIDPDMRYKNIKNADAYSKRGEYDTKDYHSAEAFAKIKRAARDRFDNFGTVLEDSYVDGNVLYPRNNHTIPREHQAQLDHVISAKRIHDDRGRILSGLSGIDLANDPSNLRFTNADLNLNKRDMSADEYVQWCNDNPDKANQGGRKGEPLGENVIRNLRRDYGIAEVEYDRRIAEAYYTSADFFADITNAASLRAVEMGLRQALGFVFVQFWICTEKRLKRMASGCSIEDVLFAIEKGFHEGLERIKTQYKEVFATLEEGFTSGALASLTTSICNIFLTTAKNVVRYIRQVYATVVQAGRVLLFNPENCMLGERVKTTTIILASGASVLAGTMVGEVVSKTPIGVVPQIGDIVTKFCSCMVSGLLSCSLLVFLDRSRFMTEIIDQLNRIPSSANNCIEIADAMENLAAKIACLDIERFRHDVSEISTSVKMIKQYHDEDVLNSILLNTYMRMNIELPWIGDFDSFMNNRDNSLLFC